ncbi:VAMP-associated protein [Phanerochaete sordida]|uniref:VAMP-associated protein n=1 Tax=Phanerochaete sordida TaxID=48140 RepID=A0A9P3LLN9_9APHY|nr:VAMP-associated protein [Phanerochaete sordida]
MSLTLNPSSTLGFPRPLTQHVKRALSISNPNSQPVAFKVKTTAPKLYCVRPNSGRVDPGETVEVQVVLQAMKEEPPLGAKCKDKFLIQSTLITPERETLPLTDIWSGDSPEDAVHQHKIRVAYLPPEGQTVPEEDEPQAAAAEAPPRPSGHTEYDTVPQRQQNGHAPPIPDFGQEHSHDGPQTDNEMHHDARETPPPAVPRRIVEESPVEPPPPAEPVVHVNVHTPPAPAPVQAVPSQHAIDPNPELVARLSDAQAEIARLRKLISSMPDPSTVSTQTSPTELRRRARSDDGSTVVSQTDVSSYVEDAVMPPEGVPLQVVIIIALGVFVTTYLFF